MNVQTERRRKRERGTNENKQQQNIHSAEIKEKIALWSWIKQITKANERRKKPSKEKRWRKRHRQGDADESKKIKWKWILQYVFSGLNFFLLLSSFFRMAFLLALLFVRLAERRGQKVYVKVKVAKKLNKNGVPRKSTRLLLASTYFSRYFFSFTWQKTATTAPA